MIKNFMLKFAPHVKSKGEKRALPFVLGLIIGGGAVYAYNNREQISKNLKQNKTLKAGIEKGEEALSGVSNAIKTRAKRLSKNLKNALDDSSTKSTNSSAKSAKSRAKATNAKASSAKTNTTKTTKAKSAKPKTARKPKATKAPKEPTLIADSQTTLTAQN